jgi:hypothetical protein
MAVADYPWGADGPPESAYGRVTSPERFAPLHQTAVELIDRLAAQYLVVREEAEGLAAEFESPTSLTRDVVRLTPREPLAASIAIAFTSLPGLRVRLGNWVVEPFPVCACDACAATAEGEAAKLVALTESVVAGGFREAIRLPYIGPAWLEWSSTHAGSHQSSSHRIARGEARRMLAGRQRAYQWQAWPRV